MWKIRKIVLGLGMVFALQSCQENKPSLLEKVNKDSSQSLPSNLSKDQVPGLKEAPKGIHTEGQNLVLEDGKEFPTGMDQLQYVGLWPKESPQTTKSYYLLTGVYHKDPRSLAWLVVHSLEDGPFPIPHPMRFPYPGRLIDSLSHDILSQTQIYSGEVLPKKKGLLIYSTYQDRKTGKEGQTTFLLEHVKDTLLPRLISKDHALLSQTKALLEKGKCREIKGGDQYLKP